MPYRTATRQGAGEQSSRPSQPHAATEVGPHVLQNRHPPGCGQPIGRDISQAPSIRTPQIPPPSPRPSPKFKKSFLYCRQRLSRLINPPKKRILRPAC